jgi:hypothetical protein
MANQETSAIPDTQDIRQAKQQTQQTQIGSLRDKVCQ